MRKVARQALRLTGVHLENWRNFTQVDTELQRRLFLVGPSASGKSNFLDAFRFLHHLVIPGGGFQEAVGRRRGVGSLRSLVARRYSDVVVRAEIGSDETPQAWSYELRFNQDSLRRPVVKAEIVRRNGQTILKRPNQEDEGDRERLTQTYLQQVHANQPFRDVADFFASIRYLHIVPQLIREPERSVGRANDPYGGDFLEQLATASERIRNARLKRIGEALKIAVPQLTELELWRDPRRGTPHLRGKYEHWRPQGAWQTEEEFSDGTLRLFGLLWAVLDGEGPLLLEEPELSLHPEVVRYVPQLFARIQRRTGRQVLVSTHSSDLLRDEGIGLDEVLLLLPAQEGTEVKPARKFREIEVLLEEGQSLADVVFPRTRPTHPEQLPLFGE